MVSDLAVPQCGQVITLSRIMVLTSGRRPGTPSQYVLQLSFRVSFSDDDVPPSPEAHLRAKTTPAPLAARGAGPALRMGPSSGCAEKRTPEHHACGWRAHTAAFSPPRTPGRSSLGSRRSGTVFVKSALANLPERDANMRPAARRGLIGATVLLLL
jgi:hypothetical protein